MIVVDEFDVFQTSGVILKRNIDTRLNKRFFSFGFDKKIKENAIQKVEELLCSTVYKTAISQQKQIIKSMSKK